MSYRVLLITYKTPIPIKDGGAFAINNIIKGYLEKNYKVDLFIISTNKHHANIEEIEKYYKSKVYIQNINSNKALLNNLVKKIPLILKRFYSKKIEEIIKNIIINEKYDFIQFEGLQTTTYINTIKKNSNAKIIYRPHNIEHRIWERISKNQKFILFKILYKIISLQLKKYEKKIINKYDIIIPITEIDANFFKINGNNKPLHVYPFGIDIVENFSPCNNNDLFFIGALDWKPNIEGLIWFITNVWQDIKRQFPDIKFYIAGRNPSKKTKRIINKLEANFIGEVEDSGKFIKEHKIMIVPLFAGSGIRVKIIEAMAYGKIIITTPIGIEGIPAQHMTNIIIAEKKEDFIFYINKILNDVNLANTISKNAYEFIKIHYNNKILMNKLNDFYNTCIKII